MMNKVIFHGKLPLSEKFVIDYRPGEEGGKRSMFRAAIDVQRDYKAKDEKYYPSDIFNFTAWGPTADFLHKHAGPGTELVLCCRATNDTYEKDGKMVRSVGFTVETADIVWATAKSDGEQPAAGAKATETAGDDFDLGI